MRCWAAILVIVTGAGCSLGPRKLEDTRLCYNEALKVTSEEQLLLNIVRLRYGDSVSSLAVSAIAAQFERAQRFQMIPFFGVTGDAAAHARAALLPGYEMLKADRPTLSYTP